jgi:hypothetical protein
MTSEMSRRAYGNYVVSAWAVDFRIEEVRWRSIG